MTSSCICIFWPQLSLWILQLYPSILPGVCFFTYRLSVMCILCIKHMLRRPCQGTILPQNKGECLRIIPSPRWSNEKGEMKMAIVQFLVIEYFVIQNGQRILARLRCTFRYLKFDIDFPFYFARSLSSAMEVISAVDVLALTLAPGHQQLKLPYLLSLLSTTWLCKINFILFKVIFPRWCRRTVIHLYGW